jgi:hypothetical protein
MGKGCWQKTGWKVGVLYSVDFQVVQIGVLDLELEKGLHMALNLHALMVRAIRFILLSCLFSFKEYRDVQTSFASLIVTMMRCLDAVEDFIQIHQDLHQRGRYSGPQVKSRHVHARDLRGVT